MVLKDKIGSQDSIISIYSISTFFLLDQIKVSIFATGIQCSIQCVYILYVSVCL